MKWWKQLKDLSYKHIIAERDIKPFLIFIFILVSFILSRLTILLVGEAGSLFVFKYHIHHFYYGIVLLTIAAIGAIMLEGEMIKRIAAAIVGIGLGLILDEIGILLTCGTAAVEACNPIAIYWSRLSYDIAIYGLLAYLAIMYFGPVWLRINKYIYRWWKGLF